MKNVNVSICVCLAVAAVSCAKPPATPGEVFLAKVAESVHDLEDPGRALDAIIRLGIPPGGKLVDEIAWCRVNAPAIRGLMAATGTRARLKDAA